MVSLLVTKMRNLEGDARAAAMAAQAEYVVEWTRLLRRQPPELSPAHARFSVLAGLGDTAVRPSHFRRRPGAQETLVALGRRSSTSTRETASGRGRHPSVGGSGGGSMKTGRSDRASRSATTSSSVTW